FPSLDSSDERTMSRIEALLDNPRGLSFTFENNIVEPPVQIDIVPEIIIPELVPNVVASPERVNRRGTGKMENKRQVERSSNNRHDKISVVPKLQTMECWCRNTICYRWKIGCH
ncbi:unnamed protein product, partial [Rotaria magnacalcarata]